MDNTLNEALDTVCWLALVGYTMVIGAYAGFSFFDWLHRKRIERERQGRV